MVRASDLLAHQPAVRALPLADEEARRAAQLLGDPVRDLRQVVEVEAQVVGPGAGLGAPVLDDLQVLGPVRLAGDADLVAAACEQPSMIVAADGVERAMLAGRRDDGPPGARGARVRDRHLGDRPVPRARLLLGPGDGEREVLEDAQADAVARRHAAVEAVAVVVRPGRPAARTARARTCGR